jgi:hypothetical protein
VLPETRGQAAVDQLRAQVLYVSSRADSMLSLSCFVSQASRAELLAELQRLQAVQFGPHWRLVDSAYLGSVLEMLLVRSVSAA